MTKINSICFHPKVEQVGGGQIPAYAFQNWCTMLGIHCNVKTEIDNNCDWMFLATPGEIGSLLPNKIEVPFALMIHAEFDSKIYPAYTSLRHHPLCKLVVVIGENYWNTKQPQFYWHPCTLPKYLMTENTTFDNDNRNGLLYAARISKWKGINKLAALSQFNTFMDNVDGIIDVYGKQTSDFIIEKGNYNLKNQRHNVYEYEAMGKIYSKYKYIWDVSGSVDYKIKIKRLNLAAIEAMKFGCVPIADHDTCYEFAKSWVIDLKNGFPFKYYDAQQRMKEGALNSSISYVEVKIQVQRIIDYMEDYCD